MAFNSGNGANGGIIQPQPSAVATTTNYTDIVTLANDKLLPDYYENLVERFGNQSIQGFLAKTSAEFPLKSDSIEWTEEGRLHLYYEGLTAANGTDGSTVLTWPTGSDDVTTHSIRLGQVVIVADTTGAEYTAYVSAKNTGNTTVTLQNYDSGNFALATDGTVVLRVVGSEFEKGSTGMTGSVETEVSFFSNNPIIMKDHYSVSGSDTAQIGWIQVQGGAESTSFGADGWLWYLKSEMDNRERFMDYLETMMLEARPAATGSGAAEEGASGTDGIFYRLDNDGLVSTGGIRGDSFANFRTDIDALLKELDKQGNVQENLLYLNRDQSLDIDNGLSLANSYGTGGQSYGAFSNSADMALNLGFMSWHRGSYTFHKTDWKYLNDLTGRSSFANGTEANIQGILTPAGSMSVYDKSLGGTAKRPFIHVRYRASQTDNRKMKHWITGSVGGVYTSNEDKMDIHYLSERCTVIQGANNFVLFKD